MCLTHPQRVVHRFGGGGDLFDRVRDVACQVDRVGNDPLGVRRSRKQQAAHEAEDKFVFHEDWGDKGNEGIKLFGIIRVIDSLFCDQILMTREQQQAGE